MIEVMCIGPDMGAKRSTPDVLIRRMSDLLGSNMTRVIGETGVDWQSDAGYEKWKRDVFLGDVQKDTTHLLALDSEGLRGFVSYTVPPEGEGVYVNEVQIRPSAQADGLTLKRLLAVFLRDLERLPHTSVQAYTNNLNPRAKKLLKKAGFQTVRQTERGFQYTAQKKALLERFGR